MSVERECGHIVAMTLCDGCMDQLTAKANTDWCVLCGVPIDQGLTYVLMDDSGKIVGSHETRTDAQAVAWAQRRIRFDTAPWSLWAIAGDDHIRKVEEWNQP